MSASGSKTRRNARKALRDLIAPQNELRITHVTPGDDGARPGALLRDVKSCNGASASRATESVHSRQQPSSCCRPCIEHGTVFMPILWHQDKPVGTFIIFLDPYR